MGQPFFTCTENFKSRWPQARSPDHEKRYYVRSKFKFSVCIRSPTVYDRFISNFQSVLSSPRCTTLSTYRLFFFLYCWPEVSGRLWPRNAKPMGQYSNSSASENHRYICFIPSLLCFNTPICNNTRLSSSMRTVLVWGTSLIIFENVKAWPFRRWLNTYSKPQKLYI